MAAREIHHLTDFGLGDLEGEHADNRNPFLMHCQHEFERLSLGHAKKALKHMNDKLHRRIVIVEQQNLVERRALDSGLLFNQKPGVTVVAVGHALRPVWVFGHALALLKWTLPA